MSHHRCQEEVNRIKKNIDYYFSILLEFMIGTLCSKLVIMSCPDLESWVRSILVDTANTFTISSTNKYESLLSPAWSP